MFGMDAKQKGWVTAVALLISVFMAGVLSAIAVTNLTAPEQTAEWRRGGSDGGWRAGPDGGRPGHPGRGTPADGRREDFMLELLTERLDLDDDQQDQIREIVASREAASREVMEAVRDRLKSVMDSVDAEIRNVLSPEQQEEFARLQEEGRETLGRRFRGGPPPGPPGRGSPPGSRR